MQQNKEQGTTVKDRLLAMKGKISAAKLTKCGTHTLGKDLLERVRLVNMEKKKEEEDKEKAIVLDYSVIAMKSKQIRAKKQDNPASMSVKELRAVLIPLRQKNEPAVPNTRPHLLEKFHEWKLRPYRDIIEIDGVNDGDTVGGGEEVVGEAVLVPSIVPQYPQYEEELGSNNNEDVKM